MTTIDYAKYENMDREQLAVILAKTQTKEKKIKADLDNAKNLIRFLKERVKEPKDEFIPFRNTKSYMASLKYEKTLSKAELAEIDKEIDDDINRNYDNEL